MIDPVYQKTPGFKQETIIRNSPAQQKICRSVCGSSRAKQADSRIQKYASTTIQKGLIHFQTISGTRRKKAIKNSPTVRPAQV